MVVHIASKRFSTSRRRSHRSAASGGSSPSGGRGVLMRRWERLSMMWASEASWLPLLGGMIIAKVSVRILVWRRESMRWISGRGLMRLRSIIMKSKRIVRQKRCVSKVSIWQS